jgi:hypothetical protein
MEEACPLKVREYVACGLPVILPYLDTALKDLPEPPWWCLQVPNREGALVEFADRIVEFCRSVRDRRVESREVEPLFSTRALEKRRLAFMELVAAGRD